MSSFNKVLLMGNLTRDPQVKQLPGNGVVAEFGIACSRRYRTSAGEDREETAFVDCSAFGRQAEVISQFCRKGKPLFIEGRIKYDSWEDKQSGAKRSKLSVVIENFQFIGGRESGGIPDNTTDRPDSRLPKSPAEHSRKTNTSASTAGSKATGLPFAEVSQFDEADIPF